MYQSLLKFSCKIWSWRVAKMNRWSNDFTTLPALWSWPNWDTEKLLQYHANNVQIMNIYIYKSTRIFPLHLQQGPGPNALAMWLASEWIAASVFYIDGDFMWGRKEWWRIRCRSRGVEGWEGCGCLWWRWGSQPLMSIRPLGAYCRVRGLDFYGDGFHLAESWSGTPPHLPLSLFFFLHLLLEFCFVFLFSSNYKICWRYCNK